MPPIPFTPLITHIKVIFDPTPISAGGLPIFTFEPAGPYSIPQGLTMIVFTLDTSGDGDAEALFQTTPVQWFETAEDGDATTNPALLPGMFMFQRLGDQLVTLLDFNSNPSGGSKDMNHHFNVVVTYDGETYGSDPTIINLPPG